MTEQPASNESFGIGETRTAARGGERCWRGLFAAGLAAACLAAAAPSVYAASLKGKPFVIDPEYEGAIFGTSLFPYRDGFAATLAQSTVGGLPDRIFFKAFSPTGSTVVDKTLIAKGAPGAQGPAQVGGVGGHEAISGKALIGVVDHVGLSNNGKATGGLLGRVVAASGRPSGKLTELDTAKRDLVATGAIVPLAKNRALAYWAVQDAEGNQKFFGRFIGQKGNIGPADLNLSRKNSVITSVTAYGSGFIVLYRSFDLDFNVSVLAQTYDAKGKKIGKIAVLSENEFEGPNNGMRVLGLEGGEIVVTNPVWTGSAWALKGQIYDEGWSKVGAEKVLFANMADYLVYSAVALPGGDFAVATVTPKNALKQYALRRFGPKLRAVGKVAKTAAKYAITYPQVLALKNGDVVATYDASEPGTEYKYTQFGQIFTP